MKLTIKQLRKLIREALEEDVPGRYRGDGEYSEDDPDRLGHGGHLSYFMHEEELVEEDEPGANTDQ